MSHTHYIDPELLKLVPPDLNGYKILDVACGLGYWGYLLKTEFDPGSYLIGLEILKPYLRKIGRMKLYDDIIRVDLRRPLVLKDKTFDIVIASEILEHMEKDEGFSLLFEIERICRKRIIVSTPANLLRNEVDIPYQQHICLWTLRDFTRLGYHAKRLYPLPRSLYLIDKLRRTLFGLSHTVKEIIAWKDIGGI